MVTFYCSNCFMNCRNVVSIFVLVAKKIVHAAYLIYMLQTQSQCNMSCLMQPIKHSLSSACISTYIATKQLQLHVLSMSRLSMSQMGTTMLGWEQLPNTPYRIQPIVVSMDGYRQIHCFLPVLMLHPLTRTYLHRR